MKKLLLILSILFNTLFAYTQNLSWVNVIGGATDDAGIAIATDDEGNVYTTGCFSSEVDFDPDTGIYKVTASSKFNSFLTKYNSSGKLIWIKSWGIGINGGSCRNLTIDKLGNIYMCGDFSGKTDFNPGKEVYEISPKGIWDVFILKLDKNGNFKWVKVLGTKQTYAYSIINDGIKDIYLCGSFAGKVDFDPGTGVCELNAPSTMGIFILKLDSSGKFVWAKNAGGVSGGPDAGIGLVMDKYENIYIAGDFYNTISVDIKGKTKEITSAGNTDVCLLKMNKSGDFLWIQHVIQGQQQDNVGSIAIDKNSNVYITAKASSGLQNPR